MKSSQLIIISTIMLLICSCKDNSESIRGWTILSNNMENAVLTIKAAKEYNINHLQLSHHIVHDLKEVKIDSVSKRVNQLTRLAHQEGIKEVTVWDHSFYTLDYYPDTFKTGPGGTLDLDNPLFWEWYKQDYREMLDLIPEMDGLILTFIETGTYTEKQYSEKMKTTEEKLATVVDAVADVVVNERKKKLYIRTFAYSKEEYAGTIGCINYIKNPEVILMMKETPHDFFLTHPDNAFIGQINKPTIVEFDTGNEYNGQGVIANTWPEYVIKRWKTYIKRPNVIGYVARTDRYGTTKVVGTANEILLYALKRTTENPEISEEEVYDEFISSRYGEKALEPLKSAFKKSFDIVTSSLYILGTNVADHSFMNYENDNWSYDRHVSGKWLDVPVVFIKHDVNKEFHYWKDIINHIAPPRFKTEDAPLATEAKYVLEQHWVDPVECMDSTFLNYILTEKRYGVELASQALSEIEQSKNLLETSDYNELFQLFKRTWLTTRLYEAVNTAYYGFRLFARGESFRYQGLEEQIQLALVRINEVSDEMKALKDTFPVGQYNWLKDAETALSYKEKILSEWPK